MPFTPCSYGCPSFPILRLHSYPRYYELYAFAGLISIITNLTLVPAFLEGRQFFRANPRLESKLSSWLTETFIRLVVTSQHGPVSVCNECKLQLGTIFFKYILLVYLILVFFQNWRKLKALLRKLTRNLINSKGVFRVVVILCLHPSPHSHSYITL